MNNNSNNSSSNKIDFKELIRTYTKKWFWFVLSLVVMLSIAFISIRYTKPLYEAKSKIKILENNSGSPELGIFQDLEAFSGSGGSIVEDEIQIIKSRSNLIEVVKDLNLNVKISTVGNILDSEIYGTLPFKFNFIQPDSIINQSRLTFFIDVSSNNSIRYTENEEVPAKVYSFGKSIPSSIGDLVITPTTENLLKKKGNRYKVQIVPVASMAQAYSNNIDIYPSQKSSNVLEIRLEDFIQRRAKDVINSLIRIYNRNAVEDEKAIADRTSNFINDRISDISKSLSTVDQNAEDFKTGKGLTDIASEANLNLSVGAANQEQLENTLTQLNISQSMKDLVQNVDGYELIPSNIGLSDPSIANTTATYNKLVSERNRLLKSSTEKSPIIQNLDQQLAGLKTNMQSSLSSMTNNLELQVNSLASRKSKINSRIYGAPRNERALRDITRKQETTESLYLYLLQKREEAQITFASASPKSKVIDSAYSFSNSPIYPIKSRIYMGAFLLGLLIPFFFIYVHNLLDNKIHNKSSLEKRLENFPVLAELPKLSKKDKRMVIVNDRSVLAESLRMLRTNLEYLMRSKKNESKKGNIIYITSSIPGEGKTFLSSNLSMILSNTNKKVLLIGGDIRNPKLYSFFDDNKVDIDKLGGRKGKANKNGLTEYLYDHDLQSKDIINSLLVDTNTIDVIYSGKIPPNPTELLMSDRLKLLLEEVSNEYDYVIVDTAPLMVVSDTLVISEFADQTIYVTRAGFTDMDVVDYPINLVKEGKLNNLSFIVNDVKESNLGYGGKYGYGYNKTMKKWWKFT